jgi:hypothetical protein
VIEGGGDTADRGQNPSQVCGRQEFPPCFVTELPQL